MKLKTEKLSPELRKVLLEKNPELSEPCVSGGSNVILWKANTDRTGDVTFSPAFWLRFAMGILPVFTVFLLAYGLRTGQWQSLAASALPFGMILLLYFCVFRTRPELDFQNQVVRKGRKEIPMTDIQAIQFYPEACVSTCKNGHRQHYFSYEINLIRKDASRINLIDQGGERIQTLKTAYYLAAALQVPVWNMEGMEFEDESYIPDVEEQKEILESRKHSVWPYLSAMFIGLAAAVYFRLGELAFAGITLGLSIVFNLIRKTIKKRRSGLPRS